MRRVRCSRKGLTLKAVAAQVGLAPTRLTRAFERRLGISLSLFREVRSSGSKGAMTESLAHAILPLWTTAILTPGTPSAEAREPQAPETQLALEDDEGSGQL